MWLKHGIEKCRICEHYISEEQGCTKCMFEWASEYPPVNDDEWDIFELDDDLEWSFLQIQDRLRFKGIECPIVYNWFDGDIILLFGCNTYKERIARALGVDKSVLLQDTEIGVTVVNLFKEKYLRGLVSDETS